MSGHRFDATIMYCLAIDPLNKMIVVLMTDTLWKNMVIITME